MITLDITVVNVALPQVAADLDAHLGDLQWVVNGYTLMFAALLLPAGSISDRVGRRPVFLVGVAVFTLASLVCGAAPSVGWLIAGRAIQGVGGALVLSTALALIAGAFTGRARQSAIGAFSAAGGAAAAMGPLIGGLVVDGLDWRWIFYLNLPVCTLVIVGMLLRVRENADVQAAGSAGRRFDIVGTVLAVAGLLGINYGLVAGPEDGWTEAGTVASLVGGAVLIGGFVWWEWRLKDRAMFDIRLMAIPSFSGAILLSFVCRVISLGVLPYLILWLSGALGHSPLDTGLRLLAMTVPIMLVAPLSAVIQKLMPVQVVMAVGTALVGVGLFTLVGVGPGDAWTTALPGLVLMGVGGAIVFPPLMGLAVDVVAPERAGMASGMTNTFFPLGTASGVAVLGALFSARIGDGLSSAELTELGVPSAAQDGVREAVASGQFEQLAQGLPPAAREGVLEAARGALTDGLAQICLIAGVVAMVGAVVALVLIRGKDRLAVAVPEEQAAEATA
ncbi:MFS transporter [Streptomyces sp. YC419]|uniref:MFS transporter n=1 Tax=Streptomyces ureilyticus TaxID=1775131 RepID=A0ABX0E625_9ACTN|nr:MFS transporter [Streptomyces ureilyticus]